MRFAGFTDDWKQRKLSELIDSVQDNDGRKNLPILTISASRGWLEQQERFSQIIAGTELQNYTLLKKGNLSYNRGNSKIAKYGTVFELTSFNEALVPKIYHSFSVKNNANATFIEYLFASKKADYELSKIVSSSARMDGLLNISKNNFINILIKAPPYPNKSPSVTFFAN